MEDDYKRGFEDACELVLDLIAVEMNAYFDNGEYESGGIIDNLLATVQESLDNNIPHL